MQRHGALELRWAALQWGTVMGVAAFLALYAIGISGQPFRVLGILVAAVLVPFLAMIVGNPRRIFLAMIALDMPLEFGIHLWYRPDAEEFGALAGLEISVTTVALVCLYAAWLAQALAAPKGLRPRSRSVALSRLVGRSIVPPALYFVLSLSSLAIAPDIILSLYALFLLIQAFLLFVYVACNMRRQDELLFFVSVLLIGLFIESALMIAVQILGRNPFVDQTAVAARGVQQDAYRSSGTLGSPNTAASYLSLMMSVAMGMLLAQVKRWQKWLAAGALGLATPALILTFSRGGWLAFALALAIICLPAYRKGWISVFVPVTLGAVVLLSAIPFQELISGRLGEGDNGRLPLIALAFRIISDHPVIGNGLNNFAVLIKEHTTPDFSLVWLYTVHNKYLLVWAETGIVALLAFIWFLISTVITACKAWQSTDRTLAALALGLGAGAAGQTVHMFFDVFASRPQIELFWLVAGLITAIYAMATEDQSLPSAVKQKTQAVHGAKDALPAC